MVAVLVIKKSMKLLHYFTHPYILIISLLIIIISGQHVGGFYILYILLALPHGGIHSLLSLIGIILLLTVQFRYKGRNRSLLVNIVNVFGAVLLVLSLFFFFFNDKEHYNYDTFKFWLSLFSLALFSVISISFIVINSLPVIKKQINRPKHSKN